jgi:hypothetical protein
METIKTIGFMDGHSSLDVSRATILPFETGFATLKGFGLFSEPASTNLMPAAAASANFPSTTSAEPELITFTAAAPRTTMTPSTFDDIGAFDLSFLGFFSTFTGAKVSLIGAQDPQSRLIPFAASIVAPLTPSIGSQQTILKPTPAQPSCTGMAGIIGAIGGFIDCPTPETTSLVAQSTATDLGDPSTVIPEVPFAGQSEDPTGTSLPSVTASENASTQKTIDFTFLPYTGHETGVKTNPITYLTAVTSLNPDLTDPVFVATISSNVLGQASSGIFSLLPLPSPYMGN